MLFFTVSGNVLATYVLPGMPALALLLTEFWQPSAAHLPTSARTLRSAVKLMLACGIGLLLVFAGILVTQGSRFDAELSHRALVRMYETTRTNAADRLVYVGQRPISAEFYAGGKAVKVENVDALAIYRASPNADFFAVREADLSGCPAADRAGLVELGKFGQYRLLREAPR